MSRPLPSDGGESGQVSPAEQRAREVFAEVCRRHGFDKQATDILAGDVSYEDGGQVCIDAMLLYADQPSDASAALIDNAEMAAFGASDAACHLYPGEDQQAERAAFCAGAAHAVAAPDASTVGVGAIPEGRQWPDIGDDPMKHTPYDDRMAVSAEALRKAYVKQQPHVPDQTALVWRWHIAALLEAEIRLRSILSRDDEDAAPATQLPAIPEGRCAAAPDHADIMETIENAGDDWQKQGYPTALSEVRDMANIGRSLLETIADNSKEGPLKGWSPIDDPAEVVTDLLNMLHEATPSQPSGADQGEVDQRQRARIVLNNHFFWGDQQQVDRAISAMVAFAALAPKAATAQPGEGE